MFLFNLHAKTNELNLIERLVFLAFLFVPLKFFTIKLGSLSLNFSRIIIAILLPIAFFYILKELSKKNPIRINSIYFNNYALLLFIYSVFSYLIAITVYYDLDFFTRIHLSSISFFESMLLLPFIFFVLVPSPEKQVIIFKKVFKFLKIFVYLSVFQFFLDLLGFSISYESIGESALENRGDIFGFDILRINSFFGEPRDLAALIVPIFIMNSILENRSLRLYEIFFILLIGIATISSSFLIVILVSTLTFGIFSSSIVRLLIFSIFSFLVTLYFFNIEFLQEFSQNNISSRFSIVFQLLNPEVIGAIANISPEFLEQISDISLFSYIFNGLIFELNGFLGHGLGSAHFAINQIALNIFNIQNENIIYGSRWIFYTLLLEIGIIGFIILILMFLRIYKLSFIANKKINNRQLIYIMIFTASTLFSSIYFFTFIWIYFSIRRNYL